MLSKIAIAIGVASIAYDWRVAHKNKKTYEENVDNHIKLVEALERSEKRVIYLINLLGEHDVELTEFDFIALNN